MPELDTLSISEVPSAHFVSRSHAALDYFWRLGIPAHEYIDRAVAQTRADLSRERLCKNCLLERVTNLFGDSIEAALSVSPEEPDVDTLVSYTMQLVATTIEYFTERRTYGTVRDFLDAQATVH